MPSLKLLLSPLTRGLHCTSLVCKNTRVGVVRRTRNQSIPLTYEQTKKPHQIGVMKSWNSRNTSNLEGETKYTAQITLQDELIRSFIKGTFPTAVLSEDSSAVRYLRSLCGSNPQALSTMKLLQKSIRNPDYSRVIIKRQCNLVRIAFLMSSRTPPMEAYFLTGYTEEMLAYLLRCVVKLEIQMVSSEKDVLFRYI